MLEHHRGSRDPVENLLLGGMARVELERILPHLQFRELPLGTVLHEPNEAIEHLYFPATGIVSLVQHLEDGNAGEIGVVGREGAVGLGLVLASGSQPNRAVIQSDCTAWLLPAELVANELAANSTLGVCLLRFTQALMTQIQQTALCNRHHTIDQQLCRWILLSLDRLPGEELTMTQDLIARMLGVRREGVTQAAGKLQRDGLIRYARGHIEVLDRKGIEDRCCECYGAVRDEYERLLGPA
jgi:CRP-like cAMP-binding protein